MDFGRTAGAPAPVSLVGGGLSSSPSAAAPAAAAPELSFAAEIETMMYGFGDARRPRADTVRLVESVVRRQMGSLLVRAADAARDRQSKAVQIEEIVFLMRKSPVKIQRLLKYLSVKSAAETASTNSYGLARTSATSLWQRGRDVAAELNTDGRLSAAIQDELVDECRLERLKRLDRLTKDLDERKYAEFTRARQANFRGVAKGKFPEKFFHWLAGACQPEMEVRIDGSAMEVLCYLAYETVGLIVDMALLVRRDREAPADDPVARHRTPIALNPQYPQVQLPQASALDSGSGGAEDKRDKDDVSALVCRPLLPSEVREAVRRVDDRHDPCAWFTKSSRGKRDSIIAL